MAAPFIVPALLLVLVLVVSAAFKLRDVSTTEDAFASLRLPAWLRRLHAPTLLPYVELALAAGLLVVPTGPYVAVTVIVLALFVAYLVVIVRALGFEEPVTCGCFGRLGLGLVDRATAARNAVLVALAIIAVGDALTGHDVIGRLRSFGAEQWGWLGGTAIAVLLTALVMRRETPGDQLPTADPGPGADDELDYVRQPIPYGMLRDRTSGELSSLTDLASQRPVLLTFLSVGCGGCIRTMEVLPGWADRHTIVSAIAVPASEGAVGLPDLGEHVTWMEDPDGAVARTFRAAFPTAVLLGADGLLAGGPVFGATAISDFLDDIAEQLAGGAADVDALPSGSR